MNLPNALTLLRIFFIPLLVVVLLTRQPNIDVQGVRNIRAAAATDPGLRGHLVAVFVAPDSLDVLRQRLLSRGPMTEDELARRMESAVREMREHDGYDYVIHSGTKDQDFRALIEIWQQVRART